MPRPPWSTVLGIVGLVAAAIVLHLEGQTARLWIDEALSVAIASRPIGDIPGLLAQDGSPPLYYVLLHGWMAVFGDSEVQTHALSLLFAVAMVPTAFWAGRSLFGRRVGWVAAALAATNPFLNAFGAETRMYTMVAFLGLVATASFLHAFAFHRRRYLPLFVGTLILLLYTHNWALFFVGGALAAATWCWFRAVDEPGGRRRVIGDAAVAFGVAGVAYLPWVPTLLEQVRHTGAPWSHRPLVREAFSALGTVMGDERVVVAFVLAGAGSLVGILRSRHLAESTAVVAGGALAAVTLGLGWLSSQLSPAWDARYFAVFLGPVLLLCALGLAREGKRGVLALVLVLLFWVQPLGRLSGLRPSANVKSDIGDLVDGVEDQLAPGDLVVAMQLEETPVLHRYLPAGLRFAAPDGPVAEPDLVDWRNAVERMRAADPEVGLKPVIAELRAGAGLLLVCARPGLTGYDVEWFRLMRLNCERWKAALAADERMVGAALPALAGEDSELVDYVSFYRRAG